MDTNSLFEELAQLGQKMERAQKRCIEIARREELLGYAESAAAYTSMHVEIFQARVWVSGLMSAVIEVG